MKILLVEDDQSIQSALAETLTRQDYTLDLAADGQQGLELAHAHAYDLIVLDIVLPKLDGISLCKRLRQQGHQTPILLLTAKDSSGDRVLGLDAGADDYITKPYDPPELFARIRALLRRGKPSSKNVIVWDMIQLDSINSQVTCNTDLVHLTPKEYCLLELFLSNPKRVFSRRAILDRLWDFAESPGEETVSTHIKCLRQKLKMAGATDPIETVHGLGYRLKAPTLTHPTDGMAQPQLLQPNEAEMSEQTTLTITATLWEAFKERYIEKANRLVQSVHAWESGHYSPELHTDMQDTAHALVGGLGVFGLIAGSHLAKELVHLLSKYPPVSPDQVRQMTTLALLLKKDIETPRAQPPKAANYAYSPLILIIDDDLALAEQLRIEAIAWDLRIEIATDLAVARQMMAQISPDLILLDLNFPGAIEGGLMLLQELRANRPKIPVLVLTGRETLADRVTVVRLGGYAFLQKPMTSHQIFQVVTNVLRQHTPRQNCVLVVDENEAALAQFTHWFRPIGVEVIPLKNSVQFWQVLTATQPDLLVLDVEMTAFSGLELCQVVRHAPQWCNLPIVFLSAYTDELTIKQAFAAGADDYLDKSTGKDNIVPRILRRLPMGQPGPSFTSSKNTEPR